MHQLVEHYDGLRDSENDQDRFRRHLSKRISEDMEKFSSIELLEVIEPDDFKIETTFRDIKKKIKKQTHRTCF